MLDSYQAMQNLGIDLIIGSVIVFIILIVKGL